MKYNCKRKRRVNSAFFFYKLDFFLKIQYTIYRKNEEENKYEVERSCKSS